MDDYSPDKDHRDLRRRRARRRGAVGACLVLAVAVAGCGAHSHTDSRAVTHTVKRTVSAAKTVTRTTPTTTTPPATTTVTHATTTSTSTAVVTAECTQAQLQASVGNGSAAAGTAYYELKLTNSSSTTCWEQAYAGVSLVRGGASGGQVQLGAAAKRLPGAAPRITLAPGNAAYATLGVADAENYPASSCKPETSDYLKVYPPNQTASLEVKFRVEACSDSASRILSIGPFKSSPSN